MAWVVGCEACGLRLAIGEPGPWCSGCAPGATVPGGALPVEGLGPVVARYVYGGPVIAALARWKTGHAPHAGNWPPLVGSVAQQVLTQQATLVAVAPQLQRLAQRGLHLPDLYSQALARSAGNRWFWRKNHLQVSLALSRADHSEVRRLERAGAPEFVAKPPRGDQHLAWLVDDVVTSGVTLLTAATALRKAGWQVQGALVLADARPQALAMALQDKAPDC